MKKQDTDTLGSHRKTSSTLLHRPREVSVIAGGIVEPDAREFQLVTHVRSETYGICSNQFLDREFKTVSFKMKVTIHDENSFSYEEDTQLQIKGQKKLFHHTDKNTLK